MANSAVKKVNGTQQFKVKVKYDDGTSEILNNYSNVDFKITSPSGKSTVDAEGNVICKESGDHSLTVLVNGVPSNTINWIVDKTIKDINIEPDDTTSTFDGLVKINNPQILQAIYTYDEGTTEIAFGGKWENITETAYPNDPDKGNVTLSTLPNGKCKVSSIKDGKIKIRFTSKEGITAEYDWIAQKEISEVTVSPIGNVRALEPNVANKNVYYSILVRYNDGSSEFINENPDSKISFEVELNQDYTPKTWTDCAANIYDPSMPPEDDEGHDGEPELTKKRRAFVCVTGSSFTRTVGRAQYRAQISLKFYYNGIPWIKTPVSKKTTSTDATPITYSIK